MKIDYCQLWLTCKDEKQAAKIADTLLDKRLVACAKRIPVSSDYQWQGKIEHSDEVLLVMESRLELFEKVEKEVAKLHSYEVFVLEAVPVLVVSEKSRGWFEETLSE